MTLGRSPSRISRPEQFAEWFESRRPLQVLEAGWADAVRELDSNVFREITFHLPPVIPVVPDLLAPRAHGKKTFKALPIRQGFLSTLTSPPDRLN
jgi:hypothetical protein